MIILGFRRSRARDLAGYLLRKGKNESVHVSEVKCETRDDASHEAAKAALKKMAGQAKGDEKSLFHAIFDLNAHEKLSPSQLKKAIDIHAVNLGLIDHNRVVVEHRKNGKAHYHIVFNLIHPITGLLIVPPHPYQARKKTREQCAKEFGFALGDYNVWPIKRWEYNRGKRTGIEPALMRDAISAYYRLSATGEEFITRLARAGYIFSRGRKNNYIIVDHCKDIHPLSRRLAGVTVAEFEKKFPDFKIRSLTPIEYIPGVKKGSKDLPKQIVFFRRYAATLLKDRRRSFLPPYRNFPVFDEEDRKYYPFFVPSNKVIEQNTPDSEKMPLRQAEMGSEELLAWAFAHKRYDILAEFGIYPSNDMGEP